MNIFQKKKFQQFLYVHTLLAVGLIFLTPTPLEILISLAFYLLILQPIYSVIHHLKYSHNYIEFRNPLIEWSMIIILTIYNFFKFSESKNYHIYHHQTWLTDRDPTAMEVRQGKLKYYLGITEPTNIPTFSTQPIPKFDLANQYFYTIKILVYSIVIIVFGLKALFLSIFLMQFYFFVFMKLHDILFHHSDQAKNKPWLFPIYFNDSRHLIHHREYQGLEPWFWPAINPQFWLYKICFKPNSTV